MNNTMKLGSNCFLNECRKIQLLSREQEYQLAVRYYSTGDLQCAHKLIISHLPFVIRIALRYRQYHVPMSDLVHEGIVGLIRAVNRFDPHRGCRLATFAICWIKGYIQNFILKCWRLVKFGTTQAQRRLFYRLKRLKAQDDAILTDDVRRTLAEDLEITEHEVIEMEIRLNAGELSLHAPLLDHPDLTLMDSVPDPAPNPEELVAAKLLRTHLICQIQNAINKLDPREKMVITKRYFAASPWTLAKLGDHFSVTRERVRQLEQRALNKLRTELESTMTEAFPN